jgi:hypothetical protein
VAVISLLLAITNIALTELNKRIQTEVAARNQAIQQRVALEALSRDLVSAIANLAVQRNDGAMRSVLADHGITLNAPAPSAEPAPRR